MDDDAAERDREIACVGGYGAPNFGDLAYAPVIESLLSDAGATATFYGLPSRAATPLVPMHCLRELHEASPPPPAILVGGGEILRSDWSTVIDDHLGRTGSRPPFRARQELRRWRYRRRNLSYLGPGPFVVDPAGLHGRASVAYLSCAVSGPEAGRRLAASLDRSEFCGVRDDASAEYLIAGGVSEHRVRVTPDALVTMNLLVETEAAIARGRDLLASATGGADGEPVLVQVAPWFVEAGALRQTLFGLARTGRQLVTLPMGHYSGEETFMNAVSAGMPQVVNLPVLPPVDLIAVISASEALVTTSLHAGIAAAVFGTRFAFAPGGERKGRAFLNSVGAPPELHMTRTWEELSSRVDDGLGLVALDGVRRAQRAVRTAYTEAVDILTSAATGHV